MSKIRPYFFKLLLTQLVTLNVKNALNVLKPKAKNQEDNILQKSTIPFCKTAKIL